LKGCHSNSQNESIWLQRATLRAGLQNITQRAGFGAGTK
jgi:hypothetical protein